MSSACHKSTQKQLPPADLRVCAFSTPTPPVARSPVKTEDVLNRHLAARSVPVTYVRLPVWSSVLCTRAKFVPCSCARCAPPHFDLSRPMPKDGSTSGALSIARRRTLCLTIGPAARPEAVTRQVGPPPGVVYAPPSRLSILGGTSREAARQASAACTPSGTHGSS